VSPPDPRRRLPSVDALLSRPEVREWTERHGREPVKAALREALDEAREGGLAAAVEGSGLAAGLVERAGRALADRSRPSLRPVLNGTGVVLHTNLGRAPLAEEAIEAARRAAGYGNVEYTLETGERGSRYDHCTALLRGLTGAEAALVVNNNAAAVSLVVNALASDREVLVSRGELVEIGGSFRIPDVVARSGGRLREVGTTNRTRGRDYEAAAGEASGLILRVHPSNYRVEGFAGRPELAELVALAARLDLPLAHDVGSGLLDSDLLPGFPPEPAVRDSVAAGAGLVTFSGDKLLGGPQAGLIVGREALVARLRSNPLVRAFRVDKTTLAALEATLSLHRDPELAAARIPTLRMLREPASSVEARAASALELDGGAVRRAPGAASWTPGATRSVVGGGSFPGFEIESAGWIVRGADPDALAAAARAGDPPLIGRVQDDAYIVDVRTLAPGEERTAAGILARALDEVVSA